jgi:enoyl-CoA hydratase/carnithine racemase
VFNEEKTRVVHLDEGFDFLGHADLRVMPTSSETSLSEAAIGLMRSA